MKYYHINNQRISRWNVGDKITFGDEYNFFYDHLTKKRHVIMLRSGESYIDHAAKELIKITASHVDVQVLKDVVTALDYQNKNLREYVFETIRKERFSHLPSRTTCCWLIPYDENALNYWKRLIGLKEKQVCVVEAVGNTFITNQKHLNLATYNLSEINDLAEKYWNQEGLDGLTDEVIFEGELTVLEIIEDIDD